MNYLEIDFHDQCFVGFKIDFAESLFNLYIDVFDEITKKYNLYRLRFKSVSNLNIEKLNFEDVEDSYSVKSLDIEEREAIIQIMNDDTNEVFNINCTFQKFDWVVLSKR